MADSAAGTDEQLVRSAVRRAGRRLIPLLVLLYFVNYLDRVNIGFAGPNGMNAELGLSATLFGVAAGVFFIGYLLLEVPSNLMLHRFGARRWIARIMVTWGVVATAMAFTPNPAVLIALRFVLGITEAGFFPGIILYLTYWFPAAQRARTTAWFMTAVPISTALGAVVSTLIIQHGDGLFGLSGWRVMFLLEGIPSVLLAAVVWFLLTDRPAEAKWLPRQERDALERALAAERAAVARTGPRSVLGALKSPRVLALSWVYFGVVYGLYALGFFLPTIIKGFAAQYGTTFSTVEQGLINAVPYVAGLVAMVVWARRAADPVVRVAVPALVGGLAIPVALYLTDPWLAIVAVTLCACGVLAALPSFWALPTAHLTGAAAAAGIGLINSLGNLSGFLAPYVTGALADATGDNRLGLWVVGACMVSAAVVTLALRATRS
ncbi:MFS transporter [Saccharothrix coeruleofusca]|uniref:MFS transporter n=1 Tax=Saccharothrix coeruleofusca TaxID=33919 RepID=A0A918AQB6_9PSEU|nr:MFS transporter [Saccharothrix coeruleofusca]MBP2335058.1 MFS family permease [Saccharothrix coeruleofusca]GGP68860.1 MFS transporter [Saccharothrix coeruleofusca]